MMTPVEVLEEVETEELKEVNIENIRSWEELYDALEEMNEIRGTTKRKTTEGKIEEVSRIYSAEELIQRIGDVRAGRREIFAVTREEGLRDKVCELLVNEAQDWDSLYEKLVIIWSELKKYFEERPEFRIESYTDLRERLEAIRKGVKSLIPSMTRKFGLRAKVIELAGK